MFERSSSGRRTQIRWNGPATRRLRMKSAIRSPPYHAGQCLQKRLIHSCAAAWWPSCARHVATERLVEDVLRVARREPPLGDEIALAPFVGEWLQEFERDRGLAAGRVRTEVKSDMSSSSNLHLRQILFNLSTTRCVMRRPAAGAVQESASWRPTRWPCAALDLR